MRPNFDRLRPLSPQDLSKIHASTLEVLKDTGIWVECDDARAIYAKHGCRVDGQRVYFTSRIVDRALSSVPPKVTILAPNPDNDLRIGGRKFAFGPTSGAPFILDAEGKQQVPTRFQLEDFIKLVQALPVLKFQRGSIIYPRDVPPANLPFYDTLASLIFSDKPIWVHNRHTVNLLAIRFGVSVHKMKEDIQKGVAYGGYGNINPTSPLALSKSSTEVLLDLAEFGIPITVAPAPMAGLTAPCTVPGLLVQQNVEVLSAIILAQMANPGAPCLYGCIGTTTDMRSMVSAIGGPETRVIEQASVQIARFYNLPTRGDVALSDSPSVDFQAGAESALNFYTAARSGINMLPGVGAVGSWNLASFEKCVLDAELAEYVRRMLKPLKFDEDSMAVDLIESVGPRGSFIAEEHTFSHFRQACYSPSIFARDAFAEWERKGRLEARQRATAKVTRILEEYRKPDLDPRTEADLRAYAREHMPVPEAPLPGE
jgi:trimethylamine---corrinoid protein Co-methyltransferase